MFKKLLMICMGGVLTISAPTGEENKRAHPHEWRAVLAAKHSYFRAMDKLNALEIYHDQIKDYSPELKAILSEELESQRLRVENAGLLGKNPTEYSQEVDRLADVFMQTASTYQRAVNQS